jgi:hypothetical protein
MKTLNLILWILAAILLSACGTAQRMVTESDTGMSYPAEHLDILRGMASGKRDAEQMKFADAIIAKAGKPSSEQGVRYTGRIKVITWTHRKQPKYIALREADFAGMIGWQGPNPPSGFYGSKLTTTYLP